jgi:thymidylate synthase (FAD)
MESAMESCLITYNTLLEKGVAPEQARMVLPQSMMTEWYWSGTLYAFSRGCNLRCTPDTQKETRDVADEMSKICDEKFPYSWKYLTE